MNDHNSAVEAETTASDDLNEQRDEPDSTNLPVPYVAPEKGTIPNFFQRLAYAFRPRANASMRQNLQEALADEGLNGDETVSPAEKAMLSNILRLREVRVADVMVARAEIEAVEMATPLNELLQLFQSSGHSRLPVFVETLDDPRGMVHIRDVMNHLLDTGRKKRRRRAKATNGSSNGNGRSSAKAPAKIDDIDFAAIDLNKTIGEAKIARPVLFVPPSMMATDLLARMQAERTQMALVIDEYGGTDGLASLEDIVEMVVGDIEDEHDDEENLILKRADGCLQVDARAELDDIAKELGEGFLKRAQVVEDDVDTMGGLIFSILGRVPLRGEVLHGLSGYEIEILDADPRRIRSATIKSVKQPSRKRAVRSKAPSSQKADND